MIQAADAAFFQTNIVGSFRIFLYFMQIILFILIENMNYIYIHALFLQMNGQCPDFCDVMIGLDRIGLRFMEELGRCQYPK